LALNDKTNRNKCIHLRDSFDFRNHICIVTDLLGQSVFDFLKGNSFVPFPSSQIQSFARQLFTSVACKDHDPGCGEAMLTSHSPTRSQSDPHRPQTGEHSSRPQCLPDVHIQPYNTLLITHNLQNSTTSKSAS
jgi:hypothetical protein